MRLSELYTDSEILEESQIDSFRSLIVSMVEFELKHKVYSEGEQNLINSTMSLLSSDIDRFISAINTISSVEKDNYFIKFDDCIEKYCPKFCKFVDSLGLYTE